MVRPKIVQELACGIIVGVIASYVWHSSTETCLAGSEVDSSTQVLRAQRFVVVDEAGKERAEFGQQANGTVGMTVFDDKKTISASLGIQDGSPRLVFETAQGTPLVDVGVMDNRVPVVILRDWQGVRRVAAIVTDTGLSSFGLYDKKENNRCEIRVTNDGSPQILMRDESGKIRTRLMLEGDGSCAMDLLDKNGVARAVLQLDGQGNPNLVFFDANSEPSWAPNKSKEALSDQGNRKRASTR